MNNENQNEQTQGYALEKENYILMAIGFAIIIVGFILMAGGAVEDPHSFYPNNDPSQTPEMFSFRRITLAPIMVLFGFAFEIFAIMAHPDSKIVRKIFRK
ncbi:MAG: DUF3098 domain-containing protein [Bacteroidales bacterium]